MPSLFSRARTFSTPQKKAAQDTSLDEFGRVASPFSTRGSTFSTATATPSKKDKKKGKPRAAPEPEVQEPQFPDGSFLPLNLERPRSEAESEQLDYGYLSYERHVVLGLEELERLLDVVADELETRGGVTTPFVFSNTALDISSSGIKRLIQSFLHTCVARSQEEAQVADMKWREEARFVGPHELGMTLRWGLARVIRSVGGQDVRGLISYEQYADFRDSEAANHCPPNHFQSFFLPTLPHTLQYIVVRLLSLLARIVANSTSSGHTPPTLSPLFGPLFFGLGPATLAFHHAYLHYLRSVNAFEHLLLAFVRWQDTPRSTTGSATSLGVPVRLKEWIKGYPAMLPFNNPKAKPQPRKGARTVRVMSVRRNVRMYSPDLVKSASSWSQRSHSTLSNSFASSKEWERIAPPTLRLTPRYSDSYKKKMNMLSNFHPDVHSGTYPNTSSSSSPTKTAPQISLSSTLSSVDSSDYFAADERKDERFRSLTDLKWGEFESMGFNSLGDEKKLQFDLTESARQERAAKRQTLSWNDFSAAGFTRTDAPLSATLQFSTPLLNTVQQWPTQQAEIHKKLKKQAKTLPAFGWDTEPVVGNEEVIEEAFIDVFCDLIYGGGWMDLERGESLDRDCNWALVEYKSLPPSRTTASGGSDPRTDTTLILFEEFVPLEYRQQLALPSKSRRRLPSLFSPSSRKQWKQAATLNGRPYVVGHVPRSPSYRELEFEGLLHGSGGTKVLSLSNRESHPNASVKMQSDLPKIPPMPSRLAPTISPPPLNPPSYKPESGDHPPPPRSDEMPSDSSTTPSGHKKSRFRLPVSPSVRRSMMGPPAEYSTVEFETRMASYSDDEWNGEPEDVKQKRRASRPDAWVDILVGTQGRRMGDQDALLDPAERRRAKIRKSDPDMASLEVAQVLAQVKSERSLSPQSIPDMFSERSERVDRDYGIDQHIYDSDVDAIETVPKRKLETSVEDDKSESDSRVADDEDDELMAPILSARQMAKEQRRLGYFDLHPERRTALSGGGQKQPPPEPQQQEEDPRERFARSSLSDDEEDDDHTYGAPEPRRPLPAPPMVPLVLQTPPKPNLEPPVQGAAPVIKISPEPSPATPEKPKVSLGNSNGVDGADKPKTPTSRTAALIEMYQQKDKIAAAGSGSPIHVPTIPVAPLNISRLPVRTASLPREQPSVPVTVPPAPAAPTLRTPTSTPSPKPSPPQPADLLPPALLEDPAAAGRISPARYVHGAPLHNVLEEPEEDE